MADANTTENWRAIVGWENLYEVSDLGRVRSRDRIVEKNGRWGIRQQRYYGRVRRLMTGNSRGKYKAVSLYREGKGYTYLVHRLVLEAFVGPCPEGMETRHFPDRDTCNNRLTNLSWDTYEQNQKDIETHGTRNRGERSGTARITSQDVKKIFELRKLRHTHEEIGRYVGVSGNHVCNILNGRRWAHTGHYESSR